MSNQCYVIAEAGLNHNGSMEIAKKLIDLAAFAGADAVKFQKRTVDKLAIKSVLDAEDNRFPDFGKSYREVRQHLEFTFEEYQELKAYSVAKGMDFIVTAFDTDAVDFLEKLGVEKYKLASHSLTNIELLDYLARLNKPTILSTGMAELDEIDCAVEIFKHYETPLSLMHCVSVYPTPVEESHLSRIELLRERYPLPIGYSGHELGYLPTLMAVSMGAQLIERHYTLDNQMQGFDHKMSLSPEELISMMRDIRNIPKLYGSKEKSVSETEWVTRRKYHVSMASAEFIPKDTVLSESMISWRNPGTGIPPKNADIVLGKTTNRDIHPDELLAVDMFD